MSRTKLHSIPTLRSEYDRTAVRVLQLRSLQANHQLSDPRPPDASRKPRVLDRHPNGFDIETVVWELPLDSRVKWTTQAGTVRSLKIENVNCKIETPLSDSPTSPRDVL